MSDWLLSAIERVSRTALKAPVHLYRWTFKPFTGWRCRHLPTCSDYALEAIDTNGAWRGFWLTLSRLQRCHPLGTSGYDPVPDQRHVHHPFWLAFRYGRWRTINCPPDRNDQRGAHEEPPRAGLH